jgi:hypothetical protein
LKVLGLMVVSKETAYCKISQAAFEKVKKEERKKEEF